MSYAFEITDSMYEARLDVWLDDVTGSPPEMRLFVLREDGPSRVGKVEPVDAAYRTARVARIRKQLFLPPGSYRAVVSNAFAASDRRAVNGALRLSWIHDPRRAAADRIMTKIRFMTDTGDTVVIGPVRSREGPLTVTCIREPDRVTRHVTVARRRGPSSDTRRAAGATIVADYVDDFGLVDFDGDGDDEVIFVGVSGGSGGVASNLYLLYPRAGIVVCEHPRTRRSQRRRALQFLDSLSFAYQDSDDRKPAAGDDPRFIFEEWGGENNVNGGPLKLRRYPGVPLWFENDDCRLDTGDIVYFSLFRSGVIAYDTRSDEHYAVFASGDQYDWVTWIEKYGAFLVMAPRFGDFAVVDTREPRLYRLPRETAGEDPAGAFRVVDGQLLVRGVPLKKLAVRGAGGARLPDVPTLDLRW
jgi:hypothetical protein